MSTEAEARFDRAMKLLPAWNAPKPTPALRAEIEDLVRQAAELGHVRAMQWLTGSHADRSHRLEWGRRLAAMGETSSLTSTLFDQDVPDEQRREMFEAAKRDEPWALLAMGCIYLAGFDPIPDFVGVPPSKEPVVTGLGYLERAANIGYGPAQYALVRHFAKQDPSRALELAKAALTSGAITEPGNARELATLVVRLMEDLGELDDLVRARESLASQGDAKSMVWLGQRLLSGKDVPRDAARARELFERAIPQHDGDAHRELGRMYEEGDGVPVDLARARELYEAAAELGADAFARRRLVLRFGLAFYAQEPEAAKKTKGKAKTNRETPAKAKSKAKPRNAKPTSK